MKIKAKKSNLSARKTKQMKTRELKKIAAGFQVSELLDDYGKAGRNGA
jgi:hypothetical protein